MKDGMRCGNSFSFLCHDINELEHSNQIKLPRVTVVMPLKGFGEHNLLNWRSQVSPLVLEFLFRTYSELLILCKTVEKFVDHCCSCLYWVSITNISVVSRLELVTFDRETGLM